MVNLSYWLIHLSLKSDPIWSKKNPCQKRIDKGKGGLLYSSLEQFWRVFPKKGGISKTFV